MQNRKASFQPSLKEKAVWIVMHIIKDMRRRILSLGEAKRR